MRGPVARTAAATLLIAAVVSLGAIAGATGPTGNGAAIRLYRDVAARTNAEPAMQITQAGYMAEAASVVAPSGFAYRWGFGAVPAGYVRATETITYAQHLGRVVWLTDVLVATPSILPIELFITRTAAFVGVVDRPNGVVGCYKREPLRDVPYRAGGRWWTAVGAFRPLIERGNQILVTVTYSFASHQPVIERDSVDATTRLFTGSVFHVGRGRTATALPFSFTQQDTVVASAPPAPAVTLCK